MQAAVPEILNNMKCIVVNEDAGSEALSVALQHPAVAADQQNVCRLLLVCKAWRRTVQRSNACTTDVRVRVLSADEQEQNASSDKAASFSDWLPGHAGIVRSISVYSAGQHAAHRMTIQQLAGGLRTAAAGEACQPSKPATNRAASGGSNMAVAPPALQLQSFSSTSYEATPDILSSLSAAALTQLIISAPGEPSIQFQKALQQLTNLRSLTLNTGGGGLLSSDYGCSIQQLRRLTSLQLHSLQDNRVLGFLPEQLCNLDVSLIKPRGEPIPIHLTRLSRLQQLKLKVIGVIAPGSALPQQLQGLELYSRPSPGVLSSLKTAQLTEVQRIEIKSDLSAGDLLVLTELPRLQQVLLEYVTVEAALEAAHVWPRLPIIDLQLNITCSVTQAVSVFRSLSALGQLTNLGIECYIKREDDAAGGGEVIQLFEPIKHLTNLRRLFCLVSFPSIWDDDDVDIDVTVEQHDWLHLSSLTQLTALHLECDWAVHSAVPVAVLMQLTALQSLDVWYRGCNGLAHALPVIGKLTNLTSLRVCDLPESEQEICLQYLTQLHKLQALSGFQQCSTEVLEQFWSVLRA